MPTDTDLAQWLANEYYELNGSFVEILEKPPTALEFSRLVHISRPVIIKGFKIPALKKWSDDYLNNEMGHHKISVAITPNGLADAVTQAPDGRLYFAEPHVDQMTMPELLSRLGTEQNPVEATYLQSQNGNLYTSNYFTGDIPSDLTEFEPLRKDVPSEVSWCSKALGLDSPTDTAPSSLIHSRQTSLPML
ncbi:hypothetical protein AX15_007680 [Amanita polypyramis BW_CC]|nr:hypothetical protein AX15_007680 [Amanita polypyramis BW_CC]